MLDAGRAPALRRGLNLFFDHADTGVVYVAAQVPGLAHNPDPQLSLWMFRDRDDGGALLQLEGTLAPDPAALAALPTELVSLGWQPPDGAAPILARPPWRVGEVKLFGFLGDAPLAPTVLATGAPSLLGDPRVVIAARLGRDAAALAEAALHGDALPTVLLFDLETVGLAGPLGIEAEADLQAIHDRLTAAGALTTPYGAAKISATWEEYLRDGLIRVEVVDEAGELEGRRGEAMRRIGEELVRTMLTPEPPPEAPPQLDDRAVAPIELSFRLTMRREELATHKRWSFRERAAIAVRYTAAASLLDLLRDSPLERHVHTVDLADAPRRVLVRAEPELAALGVAALEVDLRPEGQGDAQSQVVLTDDAPEQELEVEREAFAPLELRVRARFDPTATAQPDRETPWMPIDGSLAVVSARRLFPPRTLTCVLGRCELDWIERVELAFGTVGSVTRMATLDAAHRACELYLPGAGDEPIALRVHWRGAPDEPSALEPERVLEGDLVVLDSPFGASVSVLCVPLPRDDLAGITLELQLDDPGADTQSARTRTLAWDGEDRTPRMAHLRRRDDQPARYRHRTTFVRLDGGIERGPWIAGEQPSLVLGGDGFEVTTCEVHAIGGPAARGSVAVALELRAGEHHSHAMIDSGPDHAKLVLAHPAGLVPALHVQEFMNDGSTRERVFDPAPPLVVLPTD